MKLKRSGLQRLYAVSVAVLVAALVFSPAAVLATNGMNLEGYGPIATGMGGASMAYDNGAAAMMNNPATLSLMPEGNRFDVALGYLGPDITATYGGMSADSTATAFYMPAIGWVARKGNTSYGLGMFAQGGMGTQYEAGTFMGGFQSMAFGATTPNQGNTNLLTRSELSVGRLLVPVAYDVNPQFKIGGTLDFVWAGLDLKMVMGGAQMQDMIGGAPFNGSQTFGTLSGSMLTALGGMGLDPDGPVNWGYFNFSNRNDYTGKANATGFAGKLGGVFKINNQFSIGATYHSKTALGDLESDKAELQFNVNGDDTIANNLTPATAMTQAVKGKIKIKDFEWPQMFGVGVSYQATNNLMLVADYKWINWKDVMKDFHMTFTASEGPLAGTELDAKLYQNWDDQNVIMLGAAYAANEALTLRVGANLADNPIPDTYMNPLFPAIIKNHYTVGAGYAFTKASTADLSITYAPEVKATNGQGVEVSHSQTNAQVMYSYRF